MTRSPLALCALLLAATAHALPPVKGTSAVFAISDDVAVASPPRFGVNIDPPAMSHWNTEPWHNQWWMSPNPNPVTARLKGTATGGSPTTLVDDGQNGKGRKIGFYDVFRDGFFDGGAACVYRFADGRVSLVREGKIARYEASTDGPNRVTFAAPGPEIRAGDEYVLTVVRTEFPSSTTRTWGTNPWWLVSGFQLNNGREKELWEKGVRLALSPDAPPGGGGASLALTVPPALAGERVSVGSWLIGAQEPDWPRLHEGKTYTLRLWLKQTGTGLVDVRIASLASASFDVTSEWKEFSTEFTAAAPKKSAERFEIGTSAAGTLLMDNVSITENDGPPDNAFYPQVVDALKRFRPGALRLWVLQENRGFGKALDDVLGPAATSNLTFQETGGARTSTPVGLHAQLELCAAVGATPWIITSTLFSPSEQKNLIEYLAGPADSPYGKKRAAWGHPAPWTDTFSQIKIEMGNETWNGMFAPQNFPGRGAFYGAFSQFLFEQMKSSPWFRPDRFQFVLNGWVAQTSDDKWAFGAQALRHAPDAGAIDIAFYTGGWDAVGLMKSESESEGWLNILTYSRRMLAHRAREFQATADKIAAAQGRPGAVQSLVYEAGPGYTLPAPGKFNRKEQEEGKSLAQAINTLDLFMANLRAGFGDQAFFLFKNGHYWASHNRSWGEHAAWKALALRNTLLAGDLITATATRMVTIDLPATEADIVSQSNSSDKKSTTFPAVPDLPLLDCFPFRSGKHYNILLLSRRLDGGTPVTLNLPFDPAPNYQFHTLAADSPAAHNIDAETVSVSSQKKSGATRALTLTVPPHAAVVVSLLAK